MSSGAVGWVGVPCRPACRELLEHGAPSALPALCFCSGTTGCMWGLSLALGYSSPAEFRVFSFWGSLTRNCFLSLFFPRQLRSFPHSKMFDSIWSSQSGYHFYVLIIFPIGLKSLQGQGSNLCNLTENGLELSTQQAVSKHGLMYRVFSYEWIKLSTGNVVENVKWVFQIYPKLLAMEKY